MRLNRLDIAVLSLAGLLLLATAAVVVRGDQVGAAVIDIRPADGSQVAASAPVVIQFAQRMDPASVESHVEIQPSVEGKFTWRGDTLYFLPQQAWKADLTYTVLLHAGAESQSGHTVLHDLTWAFTTGDAGVAFLHEDEQGYELWVMRDSFSEPVQFSNTGGSVFDFAVSIDGELITYSVVNEETGLDLWLVSRDGSDAHMLLDCGADRCFAADWSVDGQIAYSRTSAPLTPADPYSAPRIWLLDPGRARRSGCTPILKRSAMGPAGRQTRLNWPITTASKAAL